MAKWFEETKRKCLIKLNAESTCFKQCLLKSESLKYNSRFDDLSKYSILINV